MCYLERGAAHRKGTVIEGIPERLERGEILDYFNFGAKGPRLFSLAPVLYC